MSGVTKKKDGLCDFVVDEFQGARAREVLTRW
jgi:hypothetical protein